MRVNVYETIEISDAQRVDLANVLDNQVNKPKRIATRDEIKAYAWSNGKNWEKALEDEVDFLVNGGGEEGPTYEAASDDLLGDAEDLLGDDEDLLG